MARIHSHTAYSGALVSILHVRCRLAASAPGGEERSESHNVVFPRAGVFVKHVGGRRVVADPTQVLFSNRGEPYRVSHPVPGGDDCTVFACSPEVLLDALSPYEPAVQDRPERPFSFTHAAANPRVLLRQQRLWQRLCRGALAPLEVEETAFGILRQIVRTACRGRGAPRVRRAGTARQRREWVERVRLLLAAEPAANPSLAALAKAVHCSPFHLARTFRNEVGLPIHQYLLRLRLSLALERLGERGVGLGALALDLGFSSHGHFTTAFQRAFGLSPSAFRRTATAVRVRETSKILEI
ncbi:MAG TPA: AraC family transcriptional regulator [Thermoanaerobaculia bacterium]|jgi:AraC-like DNA-binding protein